MPENQFLKGERPYKVIALSLFSLMLTVTAQAQSTLERGMPVQSNLTAGVPESWTFTAYEGEALSFVVESDEIDPILSIRSATGTELIANDDYNYPDSENALLEAITFARTGTYTAQVTAFGDTAGAYTITMQPGFAETLLNDSFEERQAWQSTGSPLTFQVNDEQAELSLDATGERGMTLRTDDIPADMYAQVEVENVSGNPGWTVGMVTRYQSSSTYYAFLVNDTGQWQFSANTAGGGEAILRDWVQHPAIVPGQTNFTLGMMSNGSGFDFFYDGVLIGRVADDENLIEESGQLGLLVETGNAISASFDNLLITVPELVNIAPPERILVADSRAIVPQLQRQQLLPANGEMILTVPESSATSNRAGVYEVPIAEGQTFRNFAIGATVAWTADTSGTVGCGLLLRRSGDLEYTLAYVDESGGYGLSQRDGDIFEPGIFGDNAPASSSHHLLVIANEDTLYYYVDGLFAGQLSNTPIDGGVGNAVVNFEPMNTSCEFNDTWVWRWD